MDEALRPLTLLITKEVAMPVMLLGIRHHGPGSCRHVMAYLEELHPDLILLEAPSDITPLLDFVPPVRSRATCD